MHKFADSLLTGRQKAKNKNKINQIKYSLELLERNGLNGFLSPDPRQELRSDHIQGASPVPVGYQVHKVNTGNHYEKGKEATGEKQYVKPILKGVKWAPEVRSGP